jgi:nicotinamide-nucleotide amidase
MSAAVLSIGTEITRGEITNTNASFLAEELTRLGFDVTEIVSVADDREAIVAVLRRLGAAHSVIVSTGGLGPTTDDITSECVASLLGVPLERDEASLEAIRERMSRFGRTMAASNAKQADFPRGAMILPNPHGTAPGFLVKIDRATAYFMPGVPGEMKPMFLESVPRAASGTISEAIHQIRLKTFGLPESTVNDRLAGIEAAHGVVIGYRAHFPEIEVKVLARRAERDEAERVARVATDEVRARLGTIVYAEGNTSFASAVGELLRERSLTLGVAETGTGALISELLTADQDAADVFRGAIIAHDDAVKVNVLGVSRELLGGAETRNEEVARAMAEGARRVLGASIGLGVTGPSGGTASEPASVHVALATSERTIAERFSFPGDRRQIRVRAAYGALALVRRELMSTR